MSSTGGSGAADAEEWDAAGRHCDANSDGILDLVIDSFGENRLTLLLGDGKGGFAAPGTPIEAGRKPYRNLKFRDLDGDGRCDLVMPNMVERGVTVLFDPWFANPVSPRSPDTVSSISFITW